MNKYQNLRTEVRAFCPDDAQGGTCKGAEQAASFDRMNERMDEYYRRNPQSDAMQLRKEYYRIVSEEFVPKMFRNSPFYFAAGINGGWAKNPGRWFQINLTEPVFQKSIPADDLQRYYDRCGARFILCCGPFVDAMHHLPPFTRLLQSGFSGVWNDVQKEWKHCTDPEKRRFLETASAGLEAIRSIQWKFRDSALEMLKDPSLTAEQKKFMEMAAASAERAPWEPPQTFFEGLNLFCFVREILSLTDSLMTFSLGHPDDMLYDLYQADLAAGRITPDEAYDLLCRFMVISDSHYDGAKTVHGYSDHELEQPLTIGGCRADGTPIFNELTRMIIRGHRENDLVFPKLHCRISKNSPLEFYQEIAEDTWNSRCVHTLFNDDVIIQGFLKQGKKLEDARRYLCSGCWDGYVDSAENADVANYYSMARVLESMIYQDPGQNEKFGFEFESLDDCASLEEFRDRVLRNLTGFMREFLDDYTKYGKLFSEISPHPVYSVCLDGCISSGKDDTAGGANSCPRVIVLAFLANVVDSILAVQHVCFEQKSCSVREFLDAVRNNWQGREDLRQKAMNAPYWGDNTEDSRNLGKTILDSLRRSAEDLKNERGGPYWFSIWIYREFRYWGEKMRALPDGRRNGDFLAQALNPSEFRNHEEITTTLNALSCLDYSDFISSNINLTFEREHLTVPLLMAIFRSFIEKKLQLLQPNCFSKAELEDAMVNPDQHQGLIVKVCGFSARFVSLEPEWQKIILQRYHY